VQEIALAKSVTVVCGTRTFPWENLSRTLSFLRASKWYHHLQTDKLRHIKSLQKNPGIYKCILQSKLNVGVGPVYLNALRQRLAQIGFEEDQKPPLRTLLEIHRFSESTDPRDKVFAFLGLADRKMMPFRTQPDALVPNYNRSVQDVYTDTARILMTSHGSLSLLSHVEDPSHRRIPNLSSWVLDYSVVQDPYALQYRGPCYWKASGNLTWSPNVFTMANGELEVTGYHLDTIDKTSTLQTELEDP
jgi:hypothetical protein